VPNVDLMTSRRKLVIGAAAALLATGAPVAILATGGGEAAPATAERLKDVVLTPEAVDRAATRADEAPLPESHPKVVELRGAGAKPKFSKDAEADGPSPGAPSDASVKADLREARAELAKFKRYLGTTAFLVRLTMSNSSSTVCVSARSREMRP
jgi:hypothetical protein